MAHPGHSAPLPERIRGLVAIASNLHWSWDADARALFRRLDRPLWYHTRHNPLDLLQRVSSERLAAVAEDPGFLEHYDRLMGTLERLSSAEGSWFASTHAAQTGPVAYFCAEFALHNSVPIYSGGLGVLAGDHCKACSDLGVPLVGLGLFYTKGYFDQRLRSDGWQEDAVEHFDPAITPLTPVLGPDGEPYIASVNAAGRTVHIGAWRIMVGRVPVYLLDTDIEQNDPADRQILHRLYATGGDARLRQEWVLGVGGVRALRYLGIRPSVWHANEGHATFMFLERVRECLTEGMPFDQAVRRIRAGSIFTTHTPVPAGHDVFSHEQLMRCAGSYWDEPGADRDAFLALGRHPQGPADQFHMTVAAIRLSGRVVGVAQRHGVESRRMWQSLWPGRDADHVPITHVTNGVHLLTWMANPMQAFLTKELGAGWQDRRDDPALWQQVLSLDPARLWAVHEGLKQTLLNFIREEARRHWRYGSYRVPNLASAGTLLSPRVLTIGFARRFATYKRADLIFRDPKRLREILTDPWRPVQLVFAGKAHPADDMGKMVLQRVHSFTQDPSFEGRVVFLEDYELHMAHRLVQGVDLWLNLPRVPLEASGTSGMKAALNAVPQFSTIDGWWAEGYTGQNGWAIPLAPAGSDADAADGEHFYRILEQEIVPLFYDRDEHDLPRGWIERMRHALSAAGAKFTARRMVQDYVCQHYLPMLGGEPLADDPPAA